MYKVKNTAKDLKKYRDMYLGKDIFIEGGRSVETNYPPKESSIWQVTNIEKKEETKLNTKEDKNGSSSSRRRMDGDLSDSNIKSRRK